MCRGGRHNPSGLWEKSGGGGVTDEFDRAGRIISTSPAVGSKDWGLLQLYPALQALQGPFLPRGDWPSGLQSVF